MISAYFMGDKYANELAEREVLKVLEFGGNGRLTKREYKEIVNQLFDIESYASGHEVHANIFQDDKYLFTITYKTKYGVVWFDEKDCYPEYGVNGYIFINGSLLRSFVVAC